MGNLNTITDFLKSDEGKVLLKEILTKQKEEPMDKPIFKVDPDLGIVFGFGIICKAQDINGNCINFYDSDNQHIPEDTMLKSTAEYMLTDRINNNSHTTNDVGTVVFSFPLTEDIAKSMGIVSNYYGWLVGVKPDADTLAKFVSGEYKGFSIEGSCQYIDEED